MSAYERRRPLELVAILLFSVASFAVAIAVFAGLPSLALYRAFSSGLTAGGVAWGVLGLGWLAVLANAAIRNAETRGWLVFFLMGWVPAGLRAVSRVVARVRDRK